MIAMFNRDYPSSAQWVRRARDDVARFAEYCRFGREELGEITLAVGEACNNAVEHAGSFDNFNVWCEFDGTTIVITIEDKGVGFHLPTAPVERDQLQPQGLGIFLMNHLMDKADYAIKPNDGTVLTLEKRKRSESIVAF